MQPVGAGRLGLLKPDAQPTAGHAHRRAVADELRRAGYLSAAPPGGHPLAAGDCRAQDHPGQRHTGARGRPLRDHLLHRRRPVRGLRLRRRGQAEGRPARPRRDHRRDLLARPQADIGDGTRRRDQLRARAQHRRPRAQDRRRPGIRRASLPRHRHAGCRALAHDHVPGPPHGARSPGRRARGQRTCRRRSRQGRQPEAPGRRGGGRQRTGAGSVRHQDPRGVRRRRAGDRPRDPAERRQARRPPAGGAGPAHPSLGHRRALLRPAPRLPRRLPDHRHDLRQHARWHRPRRTGARRLRAGPCRRESHPQPPPRRSLRKS